MTALAALKAHLNMLDADHDDTLLTDKIEAAITFTSHHVGKLDAQTGDPVTLMWDTAPADVRQAILMLAAHWYENREATLIGIGGAETPIGYFDLLLAHRRWVF